MWLSPCSLFVAQQVCQLLDLIASDTLSILCEFLAASLTVEVT
jgi:hypothetical protein